MPRGQGLHPPAAAGPARARRRPGRLGRRVGNPGRTPVRGSQVWGEARADRPVVHAAATVRYLCPPPTASATPRGCTSHTPLHAPPHLARSGLAPRPWQLFGLWASVRAGTTLLSRGLQRPRSDRSVPARSLSPWRIQGSRNIQGVRGVWVRRVVRCRGAGSMWGAFNRKTLTHGSSPGQALPLPQERWKIGAGKLPAVALRGCWGWEPPFPQSLCVPGPSMVHRAPKLRADPWPLTRYA